jgi:hypothetical protein
MSIKEKIGHYPVWKAVLILLIGVFIMGAIIEEIFISRVFQVFDKMITHFEKQKKEDLDDLDEDIKNAKAFDEKWHADFAALDKKFDDYRKAREHAYYCTKYQTIQEARKYLAKHKNDPKSLVQQSWEEARKAEYKKQGKSASLIELENAIKNKEFDPATCGKEKA